MKSKTVKQSEKRHEARKSVQTHSENRNGKTAGNIVDDVGITPGGLNEIIKKAQSSDKSKFQEWIELMPPLPDSERVQLPLKMEIHLAPDQWLRLAQISKREMEPISYVIGQILEDYCIADFNNEGRMTMRY
jgi:hypothetical protein